MKTGRVGLDIDAAEYEDHFVEMHVKHSNALPSVLRGSGWPDLDLKRKKRIPPFGRNDKTLLSE